ncbi:MAG TPA: alpha/beta hydrolase [Solirubrobacteraceae bacterium]
MPLAPDVQQLLVTLQQIGVGSLAQGTPQQAREAFRRLTIDFRSPDQVPEVGSVEDVADGPVPLRVYEPEGQAVATVVYFHGGGFVIGSIDTHDTQVRNLCRWSGARVVSVDYRLAPEAPWPAGVEDSVAATEWALGRFDRVAVGGDSAGGNLAAIVAQELRDRLVAQLLIYPVVDHEPDAWGRYPSRTENADGYFLTAEDMRYFDGHYTADVPDRRAPRLSPLDGDLAGLPAAVVVTAEYDPLRDEGNAYAAALREAGVRVEHEQFPGLIHGFFGFGATVPSCGAAAERTVELFRGLL